MLCEEWEQPPGKTVAQRYLIHLYVIFLVLLIKKKIRERRKLEDFFFLIYTPFALEKTTKQESGKKILSFFCHLNETKIYPHLKI